MSNIDKCALREAAEKALPAMQRLLMMPNDELFDEALLNVDGDVDAANAFNLLTGPETVLALLDELEAKEKRTERALSLLKDASPENVWDVIGRLKVVIGGDYRSESEIAAAAAKGE